MFVTEAFQGLANGFQTRDIRNLAAFAQPYHNLAVLNVAPQKLITDYVDGLNYQNLRLLPGFESQTGVSKLCARMSAGANQREMTQVFGEVLPERDGRFNLLRDLTFKKDVAAAAMGTDAIDVTLFIKRPPAEGTHLHRDASPYARFFTLYKGGRTGFTPDGQFNRIAYNNYGEHDDSAVRAATVYPDRFSLYGFKGESVPQGHKPSTHIEICAADSTEWRLGAMFVPAHKHGTRPEDLAMPSARETANRLRKVYDKWGLAYGKV